MSEDIFGLGCFIGIMKSLLLSDASRECSAINSKLRRWKVKYFFTVFKYQIRKLRFFNLGFLVKSKNIFLLKIIEN